MLTYAVLQNIGWVQSVDVIDEAALKRSRISCSTSRLADDQRTKKCGVRVNTLENFEGGRGFVYPAPLICLCSSRRTRVRHDLSIPLNFIR